MLHAIAQKVKLPRLFTAMLPGSMPLIGFRHDGLTRAARSGGQAEVMRALVAGLSNEILAISGLPGGVRT
ncbi:hypothetical protein BN439_3020 [Erwinia amylovora Ea644]|nr:hypothetical protein BN439_3020 [Erwinia amylovora Ea644]CCP08118.1 hypothetical protein BN440_3113 [Erwinia amylovora MR1]